MGFWGLRTDFDNITRGGGGLPDLLQYYKRGAPKDIFGYHDGGKVLRINLQSTDKVMVAC